jgi:nitroreductase
MMWMAEALGYDTAPMEGFPEDKVREALLIPDRIRVVALLAIGKLQGADKPYGGRFPMSRIFFGEEWGKPLVFGGEEEKAA